MHTTWVWDKPLFPNTTAECRAADVCAVSPDINGSFQVTCSIGWTLEDDIFVLVRGQSQDTVFVGVYPTLADAQAQTNVIASVSQPVIDLTDPQDFTLTQTVGVTTPNLDGFHVATVPVDLTPANATWSVWKVAGTTGELGPLAAIEDDIVATDQVTESATADETVSDSFAASDSVDESLDTTDAVVFEDWSATDATTEEG